MTVILSQKVGTEGRTRTCSGTCHTAKKDKCACICAGKYHGIARGEGAHRPKNIEEAEEMVRDAPVRVFPVEHVERPLDKLEQIEEREPT